MLLDEGGLAWILKGDDWSACAETLARAEYPEEFAVSTYLDADAVEQACLAGFMPMSTRFTVPPGFPYGETPAPGKGHAGERGVAGETRVFYTPKLHMQRCILLPENTRIGSTARRASSNFRVSIDRAFNETLAGCIDTHGDGWLTPPLTKVFKELHSDQARRQVKFISVELWKDETLVAGELGYAAGCAYASLSGFRSLSGAGTVQLAALAGILAEYGYRYWDLGMPMDYKAALGGRSLSRDTYLPLLREAYLQLPHKTFDRTMEPAPVRLPFACTRAGCGQY